MTKANRYPDIVRELSDGRIEVIAECPDGEFEQQIYRDMASYKHHLKLMRDAGAGRQGLLK